MPDALAAEAAGRACRSGPAQAEQGCVLAQPGGPGHAGRKFLQFPAGIRGVGDHVDGPAGQRGGDGPAMWRASHSREDEVVHLMTSLAGSGIATGRRIAGSFTMIAAITQLLPCPVFAGPCAEPSWNQEAAQTCRAFGTRCHRSPP